MANWTQPICFRCYHQRYGSTRQPNHVKGNPEERCCDCGETTTEGIFFRVDPMTVKFPKGEAEGPRYQEEKHKLPEHVQKVLDSADEWIRKGGIIHMKWTCLKCGSRQTFEDANKLFLEGQCEECEHISDLLDPGVSLNYTLLKPDPSPEDFEILFGRKPS